MHCVFGAFVPFLPHPPTLFSARVLPICHRSRLPSTRLVPRTVSFPWGGFVEPLSGVSSRTLIASTRAPRRSSSTSSALRSSAFNLARNSWCNIITLVGQAWPTYLYSISNGQCSRRDLNPRHQLERLASLTGLDYGSAATATMRGLESLSRGRP